MTSTVFNCNRNKRFILKEGKFFINLNKLENFRKLEKIRRKRSRVFSFRTSRTKNSCNKLSLDGIDYESPN